MSRMPDDTRIVEMLRRLGQTPVPDVDAERERALLAAFDASRQRPRSTARVRPAFAAAISAMTSGGHQGRTRTRSWGRARPRAGLTAFEPDDEHRLPELRQTAGQDPSVF